MRIKRITIVTLLAISTLPLISACAGGSEGAGSLNATRQVEVRSKGAEVMPFDLNKTLHTFDQNSEGGDQTVSLKDPKDTEQLMLVRGHLKKIADEFELGNFSDPTDIHGSEMPGLSILVANPSKFTIKYVEPEYGARLEYRSMDPEIISALHQWFEAQVNDHGSDATSSTTNSFPGLSQEHICQMHPETCKK